MSTFGALSDNLQGAASGQGVQRLRGFPWSSYVSAGHFEVYERLTSEAKRLR